ncbi:MAG TPA: hypothetical protein VE891_07250 [Allosphingosinicella sp.]|nr:hypothetical protein [Allosphingosinicella sp.]
MRKAGFHLRPRPSTPCVELELRLTDGSPWRLTVSPGIERFIGHYPLADGLDPGGALLRFRAIGPD